VKADSASAPVPPVKRSDAAQHPLDPPAPPASTALSRPAPVVAPPDPGPTGAPERAPTLEEIAATPSGERRQFNIGVPKMLRLHRRAGLYAEDHGVARQDQAAAALDAWLRERGY
jgi:hypothetical protein